MKLLFDENLSPSLVDLLADLFPNSRHVHECDLGGADDMAIWAYAKNGLFAVVSKDADFTEKAVREADPPKFVWLRIGNTSTAETEQMRRRNAILIQHFSEQENEPFLVLRSAPRR